MKKSVPKIMVCVTCLLFIIAYFAPVRTISDAQPEDEWVAHPMYISQLADSVLSSSYSPTQIRAAYGLQSSGGAGTTIAIIDAYNASTILNDLTVFSSQFNLPAPIESNFEIYNMSKNIAVDSKWITETCLDVEWAHAIAPDAKILLVQANSNSRNDLLSAIDYARSRPEVVAISMSWGGNEPTDPNFFDARLTSNYGAVFFASSGDNGSEINWPASSANVVAVGGTTLNLSSNGTVISETGWNGSGGGISTYEPVPAYQTSYGLTTTKRAIPDVSYNANPTTGVAVYSNSSWIKVGGTSAGAPQWAAIHALGLSATNTNLYEKAKIAYSSYFRDITSGSNGNFTANTGYDLVTGLGSPLTFNFGSLTVSPISGPPGGQITLNGIGFTAGSSVNFSYLNPITSTWIPIIDNLTTPSTQSFTYTLNAPDLQRNNPTNDSQPLFDNIVFRAKDGSNGRLFNTTVPYSEWRRGLAQLGNAAAKGLFGNSTNFASNVFVQNGQSVIIAGSWFSPGNASLLWDSTIDLGTATTDGNGFFNTTVLVPTAPAGQHTLTVRDSGAYFSVNLTRLPTVTNDFVDSWHTSDFKINLMPDFNVTETYYKINGGPIFNVTANGQPIITTENGSNTIEYWSTWNVYGTGIMELPHVTLTGIKLDKTAPTGSITINSNYVNTATVTLALSAADSTSGIAQMRFSNDNNEWSSWEQYDTSKIWNLQNGDGTKTVTVQFMDNAGLNSTYSCTTILDTTKPIANAGQNKNVNTGAMVTFDAGGSSDESGIVSYLWNFGDSATGTGITTTHTYAGAGTYAARVTVQDQAGNTATATVTIVVQTPTPTPSPSPTIKPTPTTNPSPKPSSDPSPTPKVPEYPVFIVLFFMLTALAIAKFTKKERTEIRK